jgi:hypothetical protein
MSTGGQQPKHVGVDILVYYVLCEHYVLCVFELARCLCSENLKHIRKYTDHVRKGDLASYRFLLQATSLHTN